ncbi:MAG TPA: hypothetical protein VEO53_11670 [Candidatus Binatia bacterium]|nr:hypothetical protein [Candidatus Binatia bacterium]
MDGDRNPIGDFIGRGLAFVVNLKRDHHSSGGVELRSIFFASFNKNIGPQLASGSLDHDEEDKGLKERTYDGGTRKNNYPPIGRRLTSALACPQSPFRKRPCLAFIVPDGPEMKSSPVGTATTRP